MDERVGGLQKTSFWERDIAFREQLLQFPEKRLTWNPQQSMVLKIE